MTRSRSPVARLRADALAIAQAGIDAVDARRCLRPALMAWWKVARRRRRCHVLAVGRAAQPMMAACLDAGVRVGSGLVVTPEYLRDWPVSIKAVQAGFPVADHRSEVAGQEALALARAAWADDAFLVLVSGGAEALLVAPHGGLTVADETATLERLSGAGASAVDVAVVLKHLSAVRGGGLAAAAPCPIDTFAIWDVVESTTSTPGVCGAALTVADASTWADALAIVARCGGLASLPVAVGARLEAGASGALPETLRPSDARATSATYRIVAGPDEAMSGAFNAARSVGYTAVALREVIADGDDAGAALVAAVSASSQDVPQPICVVTAVRPPARPGAAGRQPRFALAAASALASSRDPVALVCLDTAGNDGTLEAMGACVDARTLARAAAAGVDPNVEDAAVVLARTRDLLAARATTTDTGSLQVLLAGVPPAGRRYFPPQPLQPTPNDRAAATIAISASVTVVAAVFTLIGSCFGAFFLGGALKHGTTRQEEAFGRFFLGAMAYAWFVLPIAVVVLLLSGLYVLLRASIRARQNSDRM
jgi:glycerate 2-kinase